MNKHKTSPAGGRGGGGGRDTMLMINIEACIERQTEAVQGKLKDMGELNAITSLLWMIRGMDLRRDYSMANYLTRANESADDARALLKKDAEEMLPMLEHWVGLLRDYLEDAADGGGREIDHGIPRGERPGEEDSARGAESREGRIDPA